MTAIHDIAFDDCDRIFNDWGQPAQLIEVSPYYDPDTGQLEESEATTPVVVIPGAKTTSPRQQTLVMAPSHQRTFLIRENELPTGVALISARVRLGDVDYVIQAVEEANVNGLLLLECVANCAS